MNKNMQMFHVRNNRALFVLSIATVNKSLRLVPKKTMREKLATLSRQYHKKFLDHSNSKFARVGLCSNTHEENRANHNHEFKDAIRDNQTCSPVFFA